VEGAERVWAVPRARPADPAGPIVVHLLNRNYDAKADKVVPQKNLTLRLHRDLLANRKFTRAVAHAPKAEPIELKVESRPDHLTVTVPQLDLWAIVELGP